MSAYCFSRFETHRRPTREVLVGRVGVGGANPIRVQSMTTTDTKDVAATVKQAIALAESGCEIVRVTAPNKAAAKALQEIRAQFSAAGFDSVPLVADIHFLPTAAMEAVEHVEKVRVNPGNYADHKKFAVREYTDVEYNAELQRLHDSFSPLVKRAKELGRSLRIGTNHGSLSDRIMNRYGDTPLGMVESALEFLRIAESHGFHDMILSMKASNPKVMIEAYRLLVARMEEEKMRYPLHLGVTEAGDGEDGRIKSAIGIGSLLMDGLGDTIRVSLTEDPVYEIPVAQALARKVMANWADDGDSQPAPSDPTNARHDRIDPFDFQRRPVHSISLGPNAVAATENPPLVITPSPHPLAELERILEDLGKAGPKVGDARIEGLLVSVNDLEDLAEIPALCQKLDGRAEFIVAHLDPSLSLRSLSERLPQAQLPLALYRDFADNEYNDYKQFIHLCGEFRIRPIVGLTPTAADGIIAEPSGDLIVTLHSQHRSPVPAHAVGAYRRLVDRLRQWNNLAPLWIRNLPLGEREESSGSPFLDKLLDASILSGSLLCDGMGDLVSIESDNDLVRSTKLAYNVLQGAGARITKTEFVACPSCGRTLFDLQSTTQRIRSKTGHLKGVKIAIMGCIVNGPGEMADADFGYVGGAPGKINLYVGKECVQYNIPQSEADQRLIQLIKDHGKWIDPKPEYADSV